MLGVVERKGRPLAVYRDRHSIVEMSKKAQVRLEKQLLGRKGELELTSIPAISPEAKGGSRGCLGSSRTDWWRI